MLLAEEWTDSGLWARQQLAVLTRSAEVAATVAAHYTGPVEVVNIAAARLRQQLLLAVARLRSE